MSNPPEILLFLGRLHPLLVHLPIAFIVLLAVMELLSRWPRFRQANANAGLILALAVPACLFTVLCGWFLSLGGGYQDQLLRWHKWTGVATAFACLTAGLLYSLNHRTAYRAALLSGVMVLLVTSHFGGSLTHGSDYLARYAPGPLRQLLGYSETKAPTPAKSLSADEQPVFTAVVQPILNQNCIACHGPDKSKGGLRLDSAVAVLKGGESGPAVVPGKPSESPAVKRVQLPLTSDDHMPPDGKPQPSQADLAILQWWVEAGASTNKSVAQLKPPPTISKILEARTRTTLPAPRRLAAKPLEQVTPLVQKLTEKVDVAIGPIAPKEPWLQCTASLMGTNFGDRELAALATVGSNLRWLDLGGTAVTDAGLTNLAQMPNVTRLHLERTQVSDAGISKLAALNDLEYLNLYGTAVTDTSLQTLQSLPKLKQVYFWGTKVTPEAAKEFADSRIDKDQVEKWQQDIEELKNRIRAAQFMVVDTGVPAVATVSTNTGPINTECPVSGKAVDASITVTHEGKVVAFCCNDCKAKFQQDPKPFLAKLETLTTKTDKSEAKK